MPAHEPGTTGRWPLGVAWNGRCQASDSIPKRENLLTHCNLGYARGACSHFPQETKLDAVRFNVLPADKQKVHFVAESSHRPVEHGIAAESDNFLIRRQAEAFRESYQKLRQSS